MEVDYNKRR